MLELESVTVRFGQVRALDQVRLTVPDGAVLAVLGPSGCGKSTLLRAIAGLVPLEAGRILKDGADLAGRPTHRRGFALMFQDGQLFAHRSVGGNVGYPLRVRRTGRRRTQQRVSELLELVGLSGYAGRMPDTLSGGERQRVALARALAAEPEVLLLDEPLSALDREMRERLASDLRRILTAERTSAVLVTHDHDEAFAVADRLALLRAGRLVQSGAPDEVWAAPVDAWSARFLGYAEVLDGGRACRVAEAAGFPLPAGAGLALRRTAVEVIPAHRGAALLGRVLSVTRAADVVRVLVEVPGLGVLEGVGDPADGPWPEPSEGPQSAASWTVRLHPSRMARVASGTSDPNMRS